MFDNLKKLIGTKEENLIKEKSVKLEEIPIELKHQILHIVFDAFGFFPKKSNYYNFEENLIISNYREILKEFCAELGLLYLDTPSWESGNLSLAFYEYFLKEQNLNKLFLLIEKFFEVLKQKTNIGIYREAENKINKRFKEHLLGYKLERGKIIKYNSDYLQEEVVEPALKLINNETFAGAEREFRQALDDYKQDNNVAALNSCGRALESTMKIICDLNKWEYDVRDNAGDLIKKIFKKNKLTEDFFNDENEALMNVLRKGVPSLRNCKSGHGSGSQEKEIPDFYVDYMIHTTATAIIFLINAYEYYKSKHP